MRQIGLIWVGGTIATILVVYNMQAVYQANAVVQVEPQKIPEQFVTATVQTTLETRLDSLKQQVLSRDALWGLVEQYNLYPKQRKYLSKEEVLGIMRDDLNINLVHGWSARGPGAFEVVYKAPNAQLAAELSNRVAQFFIDENQKQRTGEAEGTSSFLNEQLAEAEQRLRQNEAVLKEFKLTHNGELPQQENSLLASMGQSRTELVAIQEALGRAQQNKLILESSASYAQQLLRERQTSRALAAAAAKDAPPLRAPEPAGPPTPPSELDKARQDLRQLRARYLDGHPEVERAVALVRRLEKEEAEKPAAKPAVETARAGGAARPGLVPADDAVSLEERRLEEIRSQIELAAREIRTLEARQQRVLAEISDSQNRVRTIPVREQQLASITRDYETTKANYDGLLNKKLAADVASNMEKWQKSQKFVLLDPARVPAKPTKPKRSVLIPAGSMLALLIGLATAFGLQLRSNSLLGEWELPPGTAVMGRIPRLNAGGFTKAA